MAFEFNIQTKEIKYRINLNSFPVATGNASTVEELRRTLDQWILPGYNQLTLEFNSKEEKDPATKSTIMGELYETFDRQGTEHKESIARFRWAPKQSRKWSKFLDQLEFAVDEAPYAQFWSSVESITELRREDKEHLLKFTQNLFDVHSAAHLVDALCSMSRASFETSARKRCLRDILERVQGEFDEVPYNELTLEKTRFISAIDDKMVFLSNPFLDHLFAQLDLKPLFYPIAFIKKNARWCLLVE